MITLVIGGSGSGKSAYAEELLKEYKGEKFYLATMKISDEEALRKVDRHRQMRAGKGFTTIECPKSIDSIISEIPKEGRRAVLLECMSNLVANEMFDDMDVKSAESVTLRVVEEVTSVAEAVDDMVIITNNVAEDGVEYDDSTMEYIKALSDINVKLSDLADKVVEVVVGIPLTIKEENNN